MYRASQVNSELVNETIRINQKEYFLEYKIGKGSGGEVFFARRVTDNQECAIKKLPKSTKSLNAYISSEIDMMKMFKHKNIIEYIDHEWQDKFVYIVMEIAQMNLKQYIEMYGKDNSLDERATINVGLDILTGLSQVHARNIIHRDLKLENIMYAKGVFKLSDFGISAKAQISNTFVGTPNYLAPEILRQENYGYKVDIWCFGIILFETYFGQVPFLKRQVLSPMEFINVINDICVPSFSFDRLVENYHKEGLSEDKINDIITKHSLTSPEFIQLFSCIFVVDPQQRIGFSDLFQHPIIKKYCIGTYDKLLRDAEFYKIIEKLRQKDIFMNEHLSMLDTTAKDIQKNPVIPEYLKQSALNSLGIAKTFYNNTRYQSQTVEFNEDYNQIAQLPWDQLKPLIKQPLINLYSHLNSHTTIRDKKLQLKVLICMQSHAIFDTSNSFSRLFQEVLISPSPLLELEQLLESECTQPAEAKKLADCINLILRKFYKKS